MPSRKSPKSEPVSVPSLQNHVGDFSDIASSLSGSVNGRYWADLLSRKLGFLQQLDGAVNRCPVDSVITPARQIQQAGCVQVVVGFLNRFDQDLSLTGNADAA